MNRIKLAFLSATLLVALSPAAFAQWGAQNIYANDGTYLGNTGSQFDPNSVNNQFGQYGSQFSQKSVNNQFGPYGNQLSPTSPNNQFAPPPTYVPAQTYAAPYQAPARPNYSWWNR